MTAQPSAGTVARHTVPASVPAEGLPAGPTAAVDSLLLVRPAVTTDRAALTRMFERCTLETRYRRFHGPVKAIPGRYLAEALAGGPFHYALVGCPAPAAGADEGPAPDPAARPDEIVALASCRTIDEGAAEIGLLIEDAWQRRGLGTRLLSALVAHASRAGLRIIEAQLLAEQAWLTRLLRPYGPCRLRSTWDGVLNVTLLLGDGGARQAEAGQGRDDGSLDGPWDSQ